MPYYQHWNNLPSKRKILARQFGSVLQDVESAFFELDRASLASLFIRYGKQYGTSSEAYAQNAYPSWKSGRTKLSGKTAERLLELVPKYLSSPQRFELVKTLREHHFQKERRHIITTTSSWQEDLLPIINELVGRSGAFELPSEVTEKATWLADGDAEAATKLLAAAEVEEAKVRAGYLEAEFRRINALIQSLLNIETLKHTIELPQGSIGMEILLRKPGFWTKLWS